VHQSFLRLSQQPPLRTTLAPSKTRHRS
jgi:hypothetical protein